MNATTYSGVDDTDAKMPFRAAMLSMRRDAVVLFGSFLDDWSNRDVVFGAIDRTMTRQR